MCQSHTGRLTGLWFLPKPAFGLNTNEWMRKQSTWKELLSQAIPVIFLCSSTLHHYFKRPLIMINLLTRSKFCSELTRQRTVEFLPAVSATYPQVSCYLQLSTRCGPPRLTGTCLIEPSLLEPSLAPWDTTTAAIGFFFCIEFLQTSLSLRETRRF